MWNLLKFIALSYIAIGLSGCSFFFGKTITEKDLKRNHTMAIYTIGEDLKVLAKELNKRGEAVVIGRFDDIQVYLQIFVTKEGLVVKEYDIDEYNFGKFDIYEKE